MWNTVCSFNMKHPVHRGNRNQNGYVLHNNTALQQQLALATMYGQLCLMQRTNRANFWTKTIILRRALTIFSVSYQSARIELVQRHTNVFYLLSLCDRDRELSLTLDKISNIKRQMFCWSLAISFLQLSSLCPASRKTCTFAEIDLRLSLIASWERRKGDVSDSSEERDGKHYRNWTYVIKSASSSAVLMFKNCEALFSLFRLQTKMAANTNVVLFSIIKQTESCRTREEIHYESEIHKPFLSK
jgi:hypothetical protein